MYRSMIYVQAYSSIIINYCILEEIGHEESYKSEYHKAELKKILVNGTDNEKKIILDAYGNDGSFI